MLALSEETETLARRLAEAQKLPVDVTVRRALEQQAEATGVTEIQNSSPLSKATIAERRAAVGDILRQLDALPVLDPRPPQEIMDELNEL